MGISEKVSIVYIPLPKHNLGLSEGMKGFRYQEINAFPRAVPGGITRITAGTVCFRTLSVCVRKTLTQRRTALFSFFFFFKLMTLQMDQVISHTASFSEELVSHELR